MAYTTVNKMSEHFNLNLHTGNGSTQSITGIGFQPDKVWIKARDYNDDHTITNSVTGVNKAVYPNTNGAENTGTRLTAFGTDGFTLSSAGDVNSNGNSYVSWNWKAGGTAPTQTYKVVVVSDSGNKYRFRNSTDTATFGASAVTLDLQEGGTYTFDVSDSTMSSHPFVIGTAANGTEYSTGVTYKLDGVTKTYSQYTSGFSSATTRQLIFTVPASAPALYYWCSVHSGMGGAINTNSTHGSSNFDGSIQSLVSANTASGFSLVSYTGNATGGATIGHGLGTTPGFIMVKNRQSSSYGWYLYHQGIGNTKSLYLHSNDAEVTSSDRWNNTSPSSTVYTVGTNHGVNGGSNNLIAYCFADKPGFCKSGFYTVNNVSDNAFIYTGFKVKWLLIKNTDNVENWYILDVERDNKNPLQNADDSFLRANTNDSEDNASGGANTVDIDLLSNGFKIRSSNTGSGELSFGTRSYVYVAIGQSLVGSNNVPATAR